MPPAELILLTIGSLTVLFEVSELVRNAMRVTGAKNGTCTMRADPYWILVEQGDEYARANQLGTCHWGRSG